METLRFRKSDPGELDLMIKARVDYCLRDNPELDDQAYAAFYESVRDWTRRQVSRGDYWGYFGYLGEELVCFSGLLISELPPIANNLNRNQGYVLSFFTYPQFRRRGYGHALMQFMIRDAAENGLSRLALAATEDGVPVYRKCGFSEPVMPYMERKL